IEERRITPDNFHAVAFHVRADDVDFMPDNMLCAIKQVGHRDVFLDDIRLTVESALAQAGEMQYRLAHGFGGDGSGLDAGAADARDALDEGNLFAKLGGAESGLLPRRARADDHQVVMRL